MHEPIGFALHGVATGDNVTLEMSGLVCRLLIASIGGESTAYCESPVNTYQRHRFNLR